ncbi:NosD domain-containing protein [Chloroflexota bacterium]
MMNRILYMSVAFVLTITLGFMMLPTGIAKAATIWHVHPGESIKAAVSSASGGDTIYIHEGTYSEENIVVAKPLTLTGENSQSTILDGPGSKYGIHIKNTTEVNINNLTIRDYASGIRLEGSDNSIITDNIILDNYYIPAFVSCGIEIRGSHNNLIKNNIFKNNEFGIYLANTSVYNLIKKNTVQYNGRGIYIIDCENNTIMGNDISYNTIHGVNFDYASRYNSIIGNTIEYNSQNGVFFIGSMALPSHYNTIQDNDINYNGKNGIAHTLNSWNDTIVGNNICGNGEKGILLHYNIYNPEVYNNTIKANGVGMRLYLVHDGEVYNNNFIGNTRQVEASMCVNTVFYLDPSIGGNYWSDWTTPNIDEDPRYVDIHYTIWGHGYDEFPWAEENGWESSSNQPPVANAGGPYTSTEGAFPNGITFDASNSNDPDNDILEFRWDFEDDGTWDTNWSSDPTAYNWWRDDWEGNARVKVTDGQLTASATAEVIITNATPYIDCMAITAVPGLAPVGQPIEVTAPFKDVGLDDTHDSSFFDWGDSSSSQAIISPGTYEADHWASGTHIYNSPGIYTITLHAIDDNEGEDTCTITVIVTGEDGCMRTIGFWKHQFGGKGSQHIDDGTLEIYLDIVDNKSKVFNEEVPLGTLEDAESLLWLKKASMRERAVQQLLASWLNFANGAVNMGDMVDTDYDGITDTMFEDAIWTAEEILRNPDASDNQLELAKDICDSINNMETCE